MSDQNVTDIAYVHQNMFTFLLWTIALIEKVTEIKLFVLIFTFALRAQKCKHFQKSNSILEGTHYTAVKSHLLTGIIFCIPASN